MNYCFCKKKQALLILFLSLKFFVSQTSNEITEPVCKDNTVKYSMVANLSKYLEKENNIDKRDLYSNPSELASKPVGIFNGIPVSSTLTNVKKYNKNEDLFKALRNHEVEAIIIDSQNANYTMGISNDLSILPGSLGIVKIGYACRKNNPQLFNELSQYLLDHQDDLYLTNYKWMGISEERRIIDKTLPGGNGELKVMVLLEFPPFAYKDEEGEPVGTAFEILYDFAKAKGYTVDFKEPNKLEEVLAAIEAGTIDLFGIMRNEEYESKLSFFDLPSAHLKAMVRYSNDPKSVNVKKIYDKPEDFDGKTLGCLSGFSFEYLYKERFPKSEIVYKPHDFDLVYALFMGDIDGFIADKPVAERFEKKFSGNVTYYDIDEKGEIPNYYAFGFQKKDDGNTLLQEFNEFLKNFDTDSLYKKWDVEDTSSLKVDQETGGANEINAAFNFNLKPFCFLENGEEKGYEIDLLYNFAKAKNYKIKMTRLNSASERISYLVNKNADITGSSFTITDERKQQLDFSDPIYKVGTVFMVRKEDKKDKVKLLLHDKDYKEISDKKATVYNTIGGKTVSSSCVFPEKYNDTILINCTISDLNGTDPYTQGIEDTKTSDKLRINKIDYEIDNLLKANSKLGTNIIQESDKSKSICSKSPTPEPEKDTNSTINYFPRQKSSGLSTGGIVAIAVPCGLLVVGAAVIAVMYKGGAPGSRPIQSDSIQNFPIRPN